MRACEFWGSGVASGAFSLCHLSHSREVPFALEELLPFLPARSLFDSKIGTPKIRRITPFKRMNLPPMALIERHRPPAAWRGCLGVAPNFGRPYLRRPRPVPAPAGRGPGRSRGEALARYSVPCSTTARFTLLLSTRRAHPRATATHLL
eukprot:363625-Chlamydomonas_euryale.AAC.11